jgi:hypothetical protein
MMTHIDAEVSAPAQTRRSPVHRSCLAQNGKGSEELTDFVTKAVSYKVKLICTDEHKGYDALGMLYPHKVVNHSQGSYVVGAVHTNTIEGFCSSVA